MDEQDFLKKITAGDETWLYGCDQETKAQLSQWKSPGSPNPKPVRQSHSKIKATLTVFLDWEGDVHHECTSVSQKISKDYCLNVLHQLRDAIQ